MKLLSLLNDKQKEAAVITDAHVRIIAGAGSGKTRVLMARIAYLIEECGILPDRILAITFTNKATNEMKSRLTDQLHEQAQGVRISTIHAFCVRILREDAAAIGYPRSFTILDPDDQKQLLRPIYKELEIEAKELKTALALSAISSYKSEGVSPSMAIDMAFSDQQEKLAEIYKRYEQKRLEMKAMDFDDLLLEGLRLLKTDANVRTKWQNRLDYLHVDEFQDVDPVQYQIIRLVTGPHAFLCVVGDPDQTIYTWRGANVNIILNFDRDFKPCRTVILNQNYRSTQPILDASNALIAYNKERVKKDLFTEIAGSDKIETHACEDDNEEPLYVARKIAEAHRKGVAYHDMAVLYRSGYSSRAFERVLRTVGIPYMIYGGIRFYQRQEIKDALAYLKLCTKPEPEDPEQYALDLAVLRIINTPRRGIGQKTIDQLRDLAAQKQVNLLEAMRHPEGLSKALANKCRQFVNFVDLIRKKREEFAPEDLLDVVLNQSGYRQMLEDQEEDERLENLQELKSDIAQSMKENPDMTLESYLQEVTLFSERNEDSSGDTLSLMTVHAAKGLEFDTVFIVNFNEGVFPSARSMEEGGAAALEEERRLCYVAMTRAKRHLTITWNRGYSYMLDVFKTPSRFLKEIPEKYCIGREPKNQPASSGISSAAAVKAAGKKHRFKVKDKVEHKVFGQGLILKVEKDTATVAFKFPHGVKQLKTTHLTKIKENGSAVIE